jgi:sphinganine C4-monooxygenase
MNFSKTDFKTFTLFPTRRFLTDAEVSLISPIAIYWAHSLTYHVFDEFQLFQKYKLMPTEEEGKNRASKYEVVKHILIYHSFLLTIGYVALGFEPEDSQLDDPLGITSWLLRVLAAEALSMRHFPVVRNIGYVLVLGVRLGMAMVVYDTWQYWVHYFLHIIPWIYSTLPPPLLIPPPHLLFSYSSHARPSFKPPSLSKNKTQLGSTIT